MLGAIAATSRKAVDETLMRCLDIVMAFPGIALAAVLVAVFGGGIPVLICAIAFLFTPPVARVVRANVLAQYGEDYVDAERVIGARTPHIMLRHVAINCAAPVLVFCTVQVAEAIVFEASLSFIGAGVRPPDPSWGSVIADGKNMVLHRRLVGDGLPRPADADHRARAERPRRGRVRRVGGARRARRAETADGGPARSAEARAAARSVELPGLAEAAARLRDRARPLPQGEPVLRVSDLAIGFDATARWRGHRRRHHASTCGPAKSSAWSASRAAASR